MKKTDKAYLAGIIDARGSITTTHHLRILIRQKILATMLPTLRELGPGGFALKQSNPSGIFIVRGKRYRLGPRKVVCYEFGVRKTQAILKTLTPYLRRKELRR